MGFCPQLAVGGTSCISLISVAAADENSLTPLHRLLPTETASLGFGGSPVGGGNKNSCFAFFRHFYVGEILLPSGRCGCVGTTPCGVYFGRKTAFSEWVLCADGHAVPSCTQCFFGTSVWGAVSLPSVRASCCRNAGRAGVTAAYSSFLCRPGARPVRAESPLVGYTRHPSPEPRTQRLTRRNTAGSQGRW